jgi:ribosome maturation factor RimP
MRLDLNRLEREITPLLHVHGVELVALEWLKGPGRGLLRLYVDLPGGDPRDTDPSHHVPLDRLAEVNRDVGTALDALDLIDVAYDLEVGSPGLDRPLQKRQDFDRFAGLGVHVRTREPVEGKTNFNGTLRGTAGPDGAADFTVKIDVAGRVYQVPADRIARARLHEIKPAPPTKPGRRPSKRQERLAARDAARAVNAAHLQAQRRAADVDPAAADAGASAPAAAPPTTPMTNESTPADAASHDATFPPDVSRGTTR